MRSITLYATHCHPLSNHHTAIYSYVPNDVPLFHRILQLIQCGILGKLRP